MATITNEEIKMFMADKSKYFEAQSLEKIEQTILVSNFTLNELNGVVSLKSPTIAWWLSLLLGQTGIDRFYAGNYVLGVLKIITVGGFGIWWIIDWFKIKEAVRTQNTNKLYAILNNTNNSFSLRETAGAVKKVMSSKEVRGAVKDIAKSFKDIVDTFEINK